MKRLPIFLTIISLIGMIGLIGVKGEAWAASSSKLGIFLLEYNAQISDGGEKIIYACPKMVTFYDPQNNQNRQNLLHEYKTKCPAGIAVVRIHDGVAEGEVDFKKDPVQTADEFFSIIHTQIKRLGRDVQLVDYLSATNEFENYDDEDLVLGGDKTKWQWVGKFWTRIAQNIKQMGLIPALREVKKLGGAWSYHGYTVDYSMNASGNTEGDNSLRYRQFYDFFRKNAPDLSSLPILITETGVAESGNKDKGYMPDTIEKFKQWLTWYDGEIGKDNYVVGATIFQSGETGQWASFNTDYIAEWLCTRLGGTDCKVAIGEYTGPSNQAADRCANKKSKAEEFKQFITDLFKRNISQLKRINQGNLPPLNIDSGGALGNGDCPDPAADSAIEGPQQHNIAASRIQPPTETSAISWWQNFGTNIKDIFSFGNKKAEEYAGSSLPLDVASQALASQGVTLRGYRGYQDQVSDQILAEGDKAGDVLGLLGSKDRAMEKALPILQCAHLPAGVGQCSETGSLVGEPVEISGTPQVSPSPGVGQYPVITPGVGCGVDAKNEGYAGAQCTLARGWCSLSCLKQFTGGDAQWAAKLSQICFLESGGDPQAGPNKGCLRGISQEYSVGLFQINLIDRCPGGIRNEWAERKSCTIVDENVFDKCVANMEIPQNNIQKAIGLSGNGNDWAPWLCASEMCGFLNSTGCPYNRR